MFSLDDVSGSLQFSHQMALTPKYYPDVYRNTGMSTLMWGKIIVEVRSIATRIVLWLV